MSIHTPHSLLISQVQANLEEGGVLPIQGEVAIHSSTEAEGVIHPERATGAIHPSTEGEVGHPNLEEEVIPLGLAREGGPSPQSPCAYPPRPVSFRRRRHGARGEMIEQNGSRQNHHPQHLLQGLQRQLAEVHRFQKLKQSFLLHLRQSSFLYLIYNSVFKYTKLYILKPLNSLLKLLCAIL